MTIESMLGNLQVLASRNAKKLKARNKLTKIV
jgi:hypothetical protein